MIVQCESKELQGLWPLFAEYEETMVWSCLQGRMGKAYRPAGSDSGDAPRCVQVITGDFCVFGGDPEAPGAAELAAHIPPEHPSGMLLMVAPGGWEPLVTGHYGERVCKITRYAIKKEPGVFEREKLKSFVSQLPEGYTLAQIDRALYEQCLSDPWSRDFVALFPDYASYEKWGLGFVALKDGEITAGASSYSSYEGGIEIEVDTREEHRRKGLAAACSARLILECLDRGLYPSWDAATLISVALAEKLGYTKGEPYSCFFLKTGQDGAETDSPGQ